jgi:hypothetical protein
MQIKQDLHKFTNSEARELGDRFEHQLTTTCTLKARGLKEATSSEWAQQLDSFDEGRRRGKENRGHKEI